MRKTAHIFSPPAADRPGATRRRGAPRLAILLPLLAATLLAGCGKRGPLEAPPGYEEMDKAQRERDKRKAFEESARTVKRPVLLRSVTGEPEGAQPDTKPKPLDPRPFVLDPLL